MPYNKEQIIKQVNKKWSKDEIIRYLYVKLAPFFQRDLDYFMAQKRQQLFLYKEGFKKNSHLVVCQTICEQYQEIYKMFGITSLVVPTNKNVVPHFGMIIEGENGWYYIDPLKDLFANQLGLKTSFFGVTPSLKYTNFSKEYPFLIDLPTNYVENLDKKLGFLRYGIYMDTFFDMLHLEMTSNKIFDLLGAIANNQFDVMSKKLRFIECNLINLGNVKGLYERNIFYNMLIFYCFNKREKKFITSEIIQDATDYYIRLCIAPKFEERYPAFFREIYTDKKFKLEKIK